MICCLAFCTASKALATVSLDQTLQATIDQDRLYYQLPALSVSVQLPGEKISRNYVSGDSDPAHHILATTQTLFEIGSLTKTMTATIILKLMDEKKLTLDDTITQWLPQYPRWSFVRIRELLNHTSGVFNYIDAKNFWQTLKENPNSVFSLEQLADMAYAHADLSQPGKQYHYTNTDYILLGLIMEKITQQSAAKLYQSLLFKPLSLQHTFYKDNGDTAPFNAMLARGYDEEGTFGWRADVTAVNTSFAATAGGVISTPADMNQFLQALLAGQLVSPNALQAMTSFISEETTHAVDTKMVPAHAIHWIEIGDGLGMGLVYLPTVGLVFMHAGGMPGYQSLYAYDPHSHTSIVLMYNVQPKQNFIFLQVAEDIFKALKLATAMPLTNR